MLILVVSEAGTRIRHGLSKEAAEAQYQDVVLKGKAKVFAIDGEMIEQLVDALEDDNVTEKVEWEEVRHEY